MFSFKATESGVLSLIGDKEVLQDSLPTAFKKFDLTCAIESSKRYVEANEDSTPNLFLMMLNTVNTKKELIKLFYSLAGKREKISEKQISELGLARKEVSGFLDIYFFKLGEKEVYFKIEKGEKETNLKKKELAQYKIVSSGLIFNFLSERALISIYRIYKITGYNIMDFLSLVSSDDFYKKETEANQKIIKGLGNALENLLDYQLCLFGFIQQEAYIKRQGKEIATVRDLKKNRNKEMLEAENNSALKGLVSSVEFDDDVDLGKLETYMNEAVKIFSMFDSSKIFFKVRYLGKHKSTGIFFPLENILAVDVNDGTSLVHEFGHYVDLKLLNSFSTSIEFMKLVRIYSSNYEGVKKEYFTTPTEVFARCFEMYWAEKIKIGEGVIFNPNFNRDEYLPIKEFKTQAFDILDNLFKELTVKEALVA